MVQNAKLGGGQVQTDKGHESQGAKTPENTLRTEKKATNSDSHPPDSPSNLILIYRNSTIF